MKRRSPSNASRALALAVVLGLGLGLVSSRAEAVPKEDAAIEEAAKARYAEGFKLYGKKRYEEARAAFLQATALKRRPAASFMLAQSSLKAGRWLEALREFDAYVADVGGEVPAKLHELVESGRRDARQHVGRLRFVVPEGAEVTVDGERIASVDTPVDIVAGTHTVVITHRDEKKTETVEATPGSIIDVKPIFVPKALVPTTDTRSRPTAPPPEPSDTSTSIFTPPDTTWPVYVAGAIGLASLASAAILGGLRANSEHAVDVSKATLLRQQKDPATCSLGDAEGIRFVCSTLTRNERYARSYDAPFTTTLIIGLSSTAIAVGWFFLAPKEGSRHEKKPVDAARVVPWVGPNIGGAAVEGRF